MTPKDVNLKYSNGRVLLTVCKKGYKNNGTWATKNADRVSGCDATHCNNASALHTLKQIYNKLLNDSTVISRTILKR